MKMSITLFFLLIVITSCDCNSDLEIRNTTSSNYTVYYDSPSQSSFGVGSMDTVVFAVDGTKQRTIRIVLFGTNLTAKEETTAIDCGETHVIILGTP